MTKTTPLIEELKHRLQQKDNSPLYLRFANTVKQAIQSGLLRQGDFLPSEREFTLSLGISRITVRKALESLDTEGIIIRSRGYGTYVSDKFEYVLKEAKGFSQQVVLRGKKPNTFWLNKSVVQSSDDVAAQLQIQPGTDVFMLKRIRYVDDDPVSIEESYVPATLIQDANDIHISLYAYFRSQNINPLRTISRVGAKMPDSEFQAHIKLPESIPVLVIKQIAFDSQNHPIEYSINHCRSDMYIFVSEE